MNDQFQILREKNQLVEKDNHALSMTYFGQVFKEQSYYWDLIEPLGQTKVIEPKKIETKSGNQILFLLGEFDSNKGGSENPEKILLEKMAKAMKLLPEEYEILEFSQDSIENDQNNLKNELDELVAKYRPRIVITLGAGITNFLLQKQERLSKVHGKFIPKTFQDIQVQVVPLFHPGFLIINPNMKRSAWMDLQKVMEFIGKS